MDTNNVMVDIETYSTENEAAIVQIGACTFDESETFLMSVDHTCYDFSPYNVSRETVKWWGEQSQEAQDSLEINKVDTIGEALDAFADWLVSVGLTPRYDGQPGIWANPPQFDLTILRHAFHVEGIKVPWHYRQERCARTVYREFKDWMPVEAKDEDLIAHRADHDAIRQARSISRTLNAIKEPFGE